MSWIDFLGYLAALTVLATFCMDTIVPLRGLAIASNVLFILYGVAGHLYPVLLLHAVLLPVNIVKIVQLRMQMRRMNQVTHHPHVSGLLSGRLLQSLIGRRGVP